MVVVCFNLSLEIRVERNASQESDLVPTRFRWNKSGFSSQTPAFLIFSHLKVDMQRPFYPPSFFFLTDFGSWTIYVPALRRLTSEDIRKGFIIKLIHVQLTLVWKAYQSKAGKERIIGWLQWQMRGSLWLKLHSGGVVWVWLLDNSTSRKFIKGTVIIVTWDDLQALKSGA